MRSRKPSGSTRPLQTCDVCKLRHQKCSGERPSCSHCELRNLHCVYSTIPAHHVDRSVVRKKSPKTNDLPRSRPASPSPPSVHQEAPLPTQNLTAPGALPTPTEVVQELKIDRRAPKPRGPRSATTASLGYLLDSVKLVLLPETIRDNFTNHHLSYDDQRSAIPNLWEVPKEQPGSPSDHFRLPAYTHTQPLLEAFLNGINSFVYICDPSEVRIRLNQLYVREQSFGHDVKASIYLALGLGACAVDQASEHESATWLRVGKESMNLALEHDQENWLWVAQATMLICLHEVSTKPAACYITLGSAIKIAQTYRIDLPFEESSIDSQSEYARWRQLWLSMITLDAWISAMLGRLPLITCNSSKDPFLKNLNLTNGLPDCTIQTGIAKMGVIVCRMLRDVHGSRRVDIRVYEQYVQLLKRWTKEIPEELQLSSERLHTPDGSRMHTRDQTSMFLLKIIHLGSMMLLTRPLLLHCAASERKTAENHIDGRMQEHAQTCVDAAIRIGYCCSAMMSRGLLTRISWPIIYFCFSSALIIMMSISRRSAHLAANARIRARYDQEDSGLNLCVNVLSYCAVQSPVAKHQLRILNILRSALAERRPDPEQDMPPPMSPLMSLLQAEQLRLPSLPPPIQFRHNSSASTSGSGSASALTSISTSTGDSSAFSPPQMDSMEFSANEHQGHISNEHLLLDGSFSLHPITTMPQPIAHEGAFQKELDDFNMSDWFLSPPTISDADANQSPQM